MLESAEMRRRLRPKFAAMLRRHWLVAGLLVGASLSLSATVSWFHWPAPAIHDEFSYLLAADTFCEGRLANPTHPHWQHFESFHIIHEPTYASKFPPGQGAFLALGQWLTGEPLVGVWLLSALAVAVTYWMLVGWAASRWAALGAGLALVHPGLQLVWGQSYWGGTLAMTGGTLVFGAAIRMRRRTLASDAVAMATGAVMLAASRPFEGLAFCGAAGAWVLAGWTGRGLPCTLGQLLMKNVVPQGVVLAAGLGALGVYNHAVTGGAFTLPYVVHERAYGQAPLFHWQMPTTHGYRHEVMERFHSGWAMDWYRKQQSPGGWLRTKLQAGQYSARFFLPGLMAALAAVALMRPQPWRLGRLAGPAFVAAATLGASLCCLWNFPHYVAPLVPVLVVGVVTGLRQVEVLGRRVLGRRHCGAVLVGMQGCLFMVAAVEHAAAPPSGWHAQRASIEKQLDASAERHLVFVRYDKSHNTNQEWVYNRADIDRAKVVWAREISPAADAELVRYFDDRKVWLVEPEARRLTPMKRDGGAVAEASSTKPGRVD